MQVLWRRWLLLQQAIDAITQLQRLFEGNQMDIAGALAQSGRDNNVNQVYNRRLVGHDFDIMEILAFGSGGAVRMQIFDHLLDGDLVTLSDLLDQFLRRG